MALPPKLLVDIKDFNDNPTEFVSNLQQWADSLYTYMTPIVQYNTLYFNLESFSTSAWPKSFIWQFPNNPPQECRVAQIDSTDNLESVFSTISPRWQYDGTRIVIQGLRGQLTAGKQYKVTFRTEG